MCDVAGSGQRGHFTPQSAHVLIKPCSVVVVVVVLPQEGISKKVQRKEENGGDEVRHRKKCSMGCSNKRI